MRLFNYDSLSNNNINTSISKTQIFKKKFNHDNSKVNKHGKLTIIHD